MLGKKIKKLREQNKYTQEDVANYLGVAPQTVYKYEKEINEPDLSTISKLADFFNVSVDYLLGRDTMQIAASTKNGIDLSDICDEDKDTIMNIVRMARKKNEEK